MYGYTAQVPRLPPPGRKTGRKPVRMLIAVWGQRYVDVFCRICLPSLLSPNNLPCLAGAHDLEVVFLTRSEDEHAITTYPAFDRLLTVAPVRFLDIDDILGGMFAPAADNYGMALTHAFFRGIASYGAAACDLDFLLWNGDFLAADGTFSTIAEQITAGVRCTFATSLRVEGAIETELTARLSEAGACLDLGPRPLLRLALQHLHPTVSAKTVNRFDDRTISHPNQFYWRIAQDLLVGRSFIWFPLQFEPEVLPEAIYGFCDYVFAPELVPSGDWHYETHSDRVLIIEIQHSDNAWEQVLDAEQPMTPQDVAPSLGYWTTLEHLEASRHLLVFNGSEAPAGLDAAQRTTDEFMEAVYRLLPQRPQWHNGHTYWLECHARAGLRYQPPPPGHPRSDLAAALRWTGYDLDVVCDGWPNAADPLGAMLWDRHWPGPSSAVSDLEAWLDRLYSLCFEAWLADANVAVVYHDVVDLAAPEFHGFGWGLLCRCGDAWARRMGPDGRAVLLLRVLPHHRLRLRFRGVRLDGGAVADLGVAVNGLAVPVDIESAEPGPDFTVAVAVDADEAGFRGRLFVLLHEAPEAVLCRDGAGFAIAAVEVERLPGMAPG
jgi:hypothetical protein